MLLCCLQCNKGLCAPCSTLCWCATVRAKTLTSQNKATVLIMAKKFNSHLQYSAVFQQLYHGLALFLHKAFDYFWQGRSNKHPESTATPSDSNWNTGWIITQTCSPSYITLINWIKHTTISQQSICGIMQVTLINVTQIYIHSVQATVKYSWNLFALHSSTIMHHLYNIQTEVIVWYSAWQRPKHAPCQDACSVLIVCVSTKYFYNSNQ